jgi:hemolysin-activating ACP:hemolysin acyltransferase
MISQCIIHLDTSMTVLTYCTWSYIEELHEDKDIQKENMHLLEKDDE